MRWLGERRPVLAWDIEATGLDEWRDRTVLSQFGDANTGWALPHDDWKGLVKEVMQRYEGPIVAHNMKYDSSVYAVEGIQVPRHRMHDTMTMCHLADSAGSKALKPAAARWLGSWARAGQTQLKQAMKAAKVTWKTVSPYFEPYWTYGALDTVITARLAEKLWPMVQPWREAYEREIEITWVLLDMEMRGIRIDVDYCRDRYSTLTREMAEVGEKWPDVNLLSSDQVADVLQREGVKLTARTEKGNLSLDDVVLESIDHPLAKDVLYARYRHKLANTYFGPFLTLSVDGFLHPNIRPLGAEKHGRMSIGRPALQGLPRTNVVRGGIIPRDGNKLLLADYEAQEMRMLVHYAQDPGLIKALQDGVDLHTYAASEIYDVVMDEISKVQRTTAKWTGFAKVYGAGPPRIAATAGVSLQQAKTFLKKYDRTFPGVVRFQGAVQNVIRKREREQGGGYGWVDTWGGRRLQVPVSKAYVGVNYIISGSCSDITKDAMIRMDRAGVGKYMILPIHDEVVFDIPEDEVEEARVTIRECMEADILSVPLTTEQKVVERWGDVYPAVVDANIQKSRKATHTGASSEETSRALQAWEIEKNAEATEEEDAAANAKRMRAVQARGRQGVQEGGN